MIIILVLIISLFFMKEIKDNERTYPESFDYPFYSISDIKEMNFSGGNFINTEGYIVKIYECPRCPPGSYCKMCMGKNIVISEDNKKLKLYDLTEKDMIIFADNTKQFNLGEKYKFSIQITDYKSTSESMNDIKLIGYDLLE